MAYAAENRVLGLNLSARIDAAVESFKASRTKRKVYTQTVNELSSLSNKELADIGMSRGMIRAVALEAANLG